MLFPLGNGEKRIRKGNRRHAILLANLTGKTQPLTIEGVDLRDARLYELGESGTLAWTPHAKQIENNTVMLIEC